MNGFIRALLAKAQRYLRSAEILSTAGDFDSAASRLYYAMFYAAEAALLTKGLTFRSHRGVLSGFGQHLVKTGELPAELHQWLLDGFNKRQMGDYIPVSSLDEQDIQDLQPKATAFVERVELWLRKRGTR